MTLFEAYAGCPVHSVPVPSIVGGVANCSACTVGPGTEARVWDGGGGGGGVTVPVPVLVVVEVVVLEPWASGVPLCGRRTSQSTSPRATAPTAAAPSQRIRGEGVPSWWSGPTGTTGWTGWTGSTGPTGGGPPRRGSGPTAGSGSGTGDAGVAGSGATGTKGSGTGSTTTGAAGAAMPSKTSPSEARRNRIGVAHSAPKSALRVLRALVTAWSTGSPSAIAP